MFDVVFGTRAALQNMWDVFGSVLVPRGNVIISCVVVCLETKYIRVWPGYVAAGFGDVLGSLPIPRLPAYSVRPLFTASPCAIL